MSRFDLPVLIIAQIHMSRPLRIEYPGAWYHIMNRGRRREKIFLDSSDYQAFVDLLVNV